LLSFGVSALSPADCPFKSVPFTAVRVIGGFWAQKEEVNRTVAVPFSMRQWVVALNGPGA
jgi:hypothetical protein